MFIFSLNLPTSHWYPSLSLRLGRLDFLLLVLKNAKWFFHWQVLLLGLPLPWQRHSILVRLPTLTSSDLTACETPVRVYVFWLSASRCLASSYLTLYDIQAASLPLASTLQTGLGATIIRGRAGSEVHVNSRRLALLYAHDDKLQATATSKVLRITFVDSGPRNRC